MHHMDSQLLHAPSSDMQAHQQASRRMRNEPERSGVCQGKTETNVSITVKAASSLIVRSLCSGWSLCCCREVLTSLGPSFVKAGQVLASRPDIVREDYMNELCTLQDDVPSFPDDQVTPAAFSLLPLHAQLFLFAFCGHNQLKPAWGTALRMRQKLSMWSCKLLQLCERKLKGMKGLGVLHAWRA